MSEGLGERVGPAHENATALQAEMALLLLPMLIP
jgi:hypothetical protein